MADEQVRLQLEIAIEQAGRAIDVTQANLSWLDSSEWYAFEGACNDLVNYYASQGDTVIGPLALGEYADFTRLLKNVLIYDDLNEQVRSQVEEALGSLERWMDEIRKETMTNLRDDHPELGL